MAKSDRCPICQVAVKPENLLRHLNETHPRHPDSAGLAARLRKEGRSVAPRVGARPFRIRQWQIVAALLIVGLVVGGYAVAPYFDPYRNFGPDSCIDHALIPGGPPYHIHPALAIVLLGSPEAIPANIGITGTCMHPIHTHSGSDASGVVVIHVETPTVHTFYLRDFFHVWNQPFSANQILNRAADGTNQVRMTVNGAPSGAYGALVLADGQQIEITYGP